MATIGYLKEKATKAAASGTKYVSVFDGGKVKTAGTWKRETREGQPWGEFLEESSYVKAERRARDMQKKVFEARKKK